MDPVDGSARDGGGDYRQRQIVEPDILANQGAAAVAFGQQVAAWIVEEVDAAARHSLLLFADPAAGGVIDHGRDAQSQGRAWGVGHRIEAVPGGEVAVTFGGRAAGTVAAGGATA